MPEVSAENAIVVGVDGSDASVSALRWAVRAARAVHADVVAVHAWEPTGPLLAPYAPPSARPTAAEQRVRAARLLTESLREVLGAGDDGAVHAVVAEGPPVQVLLRHARGARLLVLGRRVHGAFGMPPIGAVVRECLLHATVPVVAVPAPEPPVEPRRPAGTPAHAVRGAERQRAVPARRPRPRGAARR